MLNPPIKTSLPSGSDVVVNDVSAARGVGSRVKRRVSGS
jgi:hypothetical protein